MNTSFPSLLKITAWNLLFIFFAAGAHAEWKPSENISANPFPILVEASKDAQEGHYEDALAKRVWYYEFALKSNNTSYSIDRFDQKAWRDLVKVYPPARDKLKQLRDDSEKAARAGMNVYVSFEDFARFNRILGEEKQTTNLFIWLDTNNTLGATQAFQLAEGQLISDQEWKLAAKYVHAESAFDAFAQQYRSALKVAKRDATEMGRNTVKGFAEVNFSRDVTTLVALLAKAGQQAEAESIAEKARQEWDSPGFHAQLDNALKGVFLAP